MRPLLTALRPLQWSKNVFVLAAVVFGHKLDDPAALGRVALAFAAFCCAASAAYLINDLRDRESDRRHPLKRHRPLAAGTLAVSTAVVTAVVLILAALGLSAYLGGRFAAFLIAYVLMNLLYSNGLKHVVILDVMILAAGFVLRVLAGAAAVDVAVSSWLLLCTIFLSLFLGFSKRRHELVLLADEAARQRKVLEHYSPAFLDQMINVVTASAVISYALYAVAPETVQKYGSERLLYTLPMVLFGIFRYLYLMYQRDDQRNPTEAILRDLPFLLNVALWGAMAVWVVYGR